MSWVNFALGWPAGSPAYHTPLACRYQQILHRNLVYLATIADSNQNMQSLLPAVSAKGAGRLPPCLAQSGTASDRQRGSRGLRSYLALPRSPTGGEKGQVLP